MLTVSKQCQEALTEQGYYDIEEYFQSLADDNNLSYSDVEGLFHSFDEEELFDMFVVACETLGEREMIDEDDGNEEE
jgi:hypothetical protein